MDPYWQQAQQPNGDPWELGMQLLERSGNHEGEYQEDLEPQQQQQQQQQQQEDDPFLAWLEQVQRQQSRHH